MRQISRAEQIQSQLLRMEAEVVAMWQRGTDSLEGAAIEIQVDMELFDVDAEENFHERAEEYVLLTYFERFEVFLKVAGFPGWPHIDSELDNLTLTELRLAFAYAYIGPIKETVNNVRQGKSRRWGLVCNHMIAIAQAITAAKTSTALEKAGPTSLAQLGGRGRAKRYAPLQAVAIKEFRSRKWRSTRQAAVAIAPKILEKAKAEDLRLSEDRVEQTVYEWLLKDTSAAKRMR